MIKKFGIIGAGAIGCSLGSALQKAYGDRFYLVALPPRADRLKKGILVNGELFQPQICDRPTIADFDLIIICVKNYHLSQTLNDLKRFVRKKTILLPLLNGVTAVDSVRRVFPNNVVPYGIVLRTDAERIGKQVSVKVRGEIEIGFAKEDKWTINLEEIRQIFINAGIESNIYSDMKYMLWRKWMINIGANQVSAMTDAQFKFFGEIEEIKILLRASIREILEISYHYKIGLTEQDAEDIVDILIHYPPEKKTSMLQDIEAKRVTEIDAFAGTVMRYGNEVGVPTPVNEVMYYALKAREKVGLSKKRELEGGAKNER